MAIYLLDTSVMVDVLNRKRGRSALLASLNASGDTLACSVVSITEVYAGIRPREIEATELFLGGLALYAVDADLARYAGLLRNEWAKKGRTLALADVLIAATALLHGLSLMTDNRQDFPMPQLAFYPLP